ncbi:Autophagy protein 22 [Vermiconidia calcicola]|uniref:Autophagy protein 22 n=1 Tax=Vermiconidia calcicola TaxID=1690605 RepID=A0ACC3ML43_9PEZI|nr:Autophagy protein 22 [Vermiconidia calcicola]
MNEPAEMSSPPAYPGKDTRRTSRKELLGFYTYSFAAEVFVVCGLGAFIPITLEDLARGSATAVLANDHSQPCKLKNIEAHSVDHAPHHGGTQCVIKLFGGEINTASFAMYTFSVSVLLQALVVVTMSGAADHGRYRKTLLFAFAFVGSIATMLFLPVTPAVYLLGSLWAIVGNVCFGASFVLLNSFLPLLVRHYPAARERPQPTDAERVPADDDEPHRVPIDPLASTQALIRHQTLYCLIVESIQADNFEIAAEDEQRHSEEHTIGDVVDPSAPLLRSDQQTARYPPSPAASLPEMQLSTKISSYGIGIGYTAAVVVQVLAVVILKLTGATLFSLRLVLFVIGLWWLCFTIPAAFWLRPRPGPPLSFGKEGQTRSWLAYITYSWKNLGRTIVRARRLKDVLLFLAAWFMISDAVATISGTAILFAKTTLGMESSALAMINVIVTLSGIAGAFTWSKVSRMMQLKPSQTILTCICLFEIIPIYGLLGYIPAIQRFGSFGLQQQWEMYPVGAVYGLVLGGLSSYCRSLFGELIPPGSEAAFYALYAITDKGSSVFGPAIVGAITDATGDIRPAFWFLAVLIGAPIPLMFLVDVDRGKREGAALAREAHARVNEPGDGE